MPRPISKLAEGWWDYTTLDPEILQDAAKLTPKDLVQLSRPGFEVRIYETVQEFYAAQALEYIDAWQQSTPDRPAGICGPIGPTEQLPIVAQMVNALGLDLKKREAESIKRANSFDTDPRHDYRHRALQHRRCSQGTGPSKKTRASPAHRHPALS